MAPVEITDDYYAILEISQTASAVEIKKSYRRLAILRHPDKNQSKPDATASFQLLNRAYETLKDESCRRIYDIKWPHIAKTFRTKQETANREAEAARAKSENAAREKAAREAEEKKSRATIEGLTKRKRDFEAAAFEVKRTVTKLQADLKDIKTGDDKALEEEQRRNSWFTYAYSSIFHVPEESETVKQERDLQRLQRVARRSIKETELARAEKKLKEWNDLLSGVEKSIAAELASRHEKEMKAEREKEEVKQREKVAAWRKFYEEVEERERASRAAAAAKAARERAAAEAVRREAEQRRKVEHEERRKREAERERQWREWREKEQREREEQRKNDEEEEKERQRHLEELRRRSKAKSKTTVPQSKGTRTKASSSTSCQHGGWWEKVELGSLACENCYGVQRRFLFECPNCQMRACAECRISLKERGRNGRQHQRNYMDD